MRYKVRAREYSPRVAQGQSRTPSSLNPRLSLSFPFILLDYIHHREQNRRCTISPLYFFSLLLLLAGGSLSPLTPFYRDSLVFLCFSGNEGNFPLYDRGLYYYCSSSQFRSHYLIDYTEWCTCGWSLWFRNGYLIPIASLFGVGRRKTKGEGFSWNVAEEK